MRWVLWCTIVLVIQVAAEARQKDAFQDPFHNVFKCEGRAELGVGEGELQRCENTDLTFHCAPTDMIEYIDRFKSGDKYMLHLRNGTHWGQLAIGYNDHTLYLWDPKTSSTKYVHWVFQQTGDQKCCEDGMNSKGDPTESAKCEKSCMWDKVVPVDQYHNQKSTPEFAMKMRYQLYEHGKARAKVGVQRTVQTPRMGEFSEEPGRLDGLLPAEVANVLAKIRSRDFVRSKYVEGAEVIRDFKIPLDENTLSSWAPSFPRMAVISRNKDNLKAHMNRLLRGQGGDYRKWMDNSEGEELLMRNLRSFKINMKTSKQLITNRDLSMVKVDKFQAYRNAKLAPNNYGYCEGLQKLDMGFSDLVDNCNKDEHCEWAWCHMQCVHKHRKEMFDGDCTCDGVDTIEVGMRLQYCEELEGCYYDVGLKNCEAEDMMESEHPLMSYSKRDGMLNRLRERQYAQAGMSDQVGFINAEGPGVEKWIPHKRLGVLEEEDDDHDVGLMSITSSPSPSPDAIIDKGGSLVHSPHKSPPSSHGALHPDRMSKEKLQLKYQSQMVNDAKDWIGHQINSPQWLSPASSNAGEPHSPPFGDRINDEGPRPQPAPVRLRAHEEDGPPDEEDGPPDQEDAPPDRTPPGGSPQSFDTMSMSEFLEKKKNASKPPTMDLHEISHADNHQDPSGGLSG